VSPTTRSSRPPIKADLRASTSLNAAGAGPSPATGNASRALAAFRDNRLPASRAARVTALFLPTDGDRASIWAGFLAAAS